MSADDDHDAWWSQLPNSRKGQIRRWLGEAAGHAGQVPGQMPLIDLERIEDGNVENHRRRD